MNDENVQNTKKTALAIQALAMNYVRAKKGKCNLKARQMDYTSPWTSDFKYRCFVPGSKVLWVRLCEMTPDVLSVHLVIKSLPNVFYAELAYVKAS